MTGPTTTAAPAGKEQSTRTRFGVLAANFLVLGLNYADRAAIGVAAPLIIADLGLSKAAFGWILAVFAFTYSPFGFIGGWLADRHGPRKVMGWAVVAWSIFTGLTAAGVGFVSMVVIRLLFGVGEGPQATVTAKLMHNWFPRRELGKSVGIANAATPLGGAVATPLVVALMNATNGNWRVPFVVLGVLGLLVAIGWFAVVRDTPELHRRVSEAELATIRDDAAGSDDAVQEGTAGLWQYVLRPTVWATAAAYFGYAWILWTFLSWFPTYLVKARGIDLDALAVAGAVPWVGGCIGLIAGGLFTDWLTRRTGNSAGSRRWCVVVCLVVTALLFGLIGFVHTTLGAVALMTIVVFLLYVTGAQYWIIVGAAVPRVRYGTVSGAVQMFATTASILAPLITGYLAESSAGWTGVFVLACVVALIGAGLLGIWGGTGRERIRASG
ncbi:MAG: MFS transporter [Streptosporangiales bacterium]